MKKLYKITWAVALVCSLALITLIILTSDQTDGFPWFMYVIDVAVFAIIALLYYLLRGSSEKKFEKALANEGITAEKSYEWEERNLLIDFTSRKFATNYFVVKQVFSFDEIVGSMVEISGKTEDRVLPPDKLRVSLLVSVKMRENNDKLFFLPMFCVIIDSDDADKIGYAMPEDITAKYPDLSQITELRADIRKILEQNHVDGYVSRAPVYEDLQDFTESVVNTSFRRDSRL